MQDRSQLPPKKVPLKKTERGNANHHSIQNKNYSEELISQRRTRPISVKCFRYRDKPHYLPKQGVKIQPVGRTHSPKISNRYAKNLHVS